MAEYALSAISRTEMGKKVQAIREEGLVPGVVYGGKQSFNIKLKKNELEKVFSSAGESSIVELEIDGKKLPVLIHDYQKHPVTGNFDHVDFYEVDMTKEIKAKVTISFIGESPAIKELGGTLVKNLHEIEIKCLPKDLLHSIEVDISSLKTYEDAIHLKDLNLPSTVKVALSPETLVAKVVEVKEEVVEVVVSEAEAVQAVASAVVKEKKEGEEDGAEAPAKAAPAKKDSKK